MLKLLEFEKSYGAITVLRIDALNLKPGIFWIKGKNGSGKSTLLKAIAGMISFEGDILLGDLSIKKNPIAYRKQVNFAEAEPIFPEFLTGKEMIRLFATAKDAPAGQEEYFISGLKMNPYLNEPVGTYSSGMLKKLSIVLAFLGKPKLILLDEPLITIDSDSLAIIYQWIEKKHLTENISFLVSSHQTLAFSSVVTHEISVDRNTATIQT